MKKDGKIQIVAVKKFSKKITDIANLSQEVKSMQLEVRMLKDFPHPLVIKYIDSFKDSDDNAYLVTEFAESLDLK